MTTFRLRINFRVALPVIFIFLHIFVLQGHTQSPPSPYKIRYLTVDEGLSHTDANDIAQDNRGFIWIATYFGLDRYDGYSIKRFYNSNEPLKNASKNRLRCVYPDKEGNIWLGTEGGLQRFDARRETYLEYESDRSQGTFEKIYKPDSSNRIYGIVGGEFRMYLVNGNTIARQPLQIPDGVRITDFVAGPEGFLYLSSNHGIFTMDTAGRFRKIEVAGMPDPWFSHLYINRERQLLLSSGHKLFLTRTVGPANGQVLHTERQYEVSNGRDIRNILQDEDHDYWINEGSSLIRLNKNLIPVQTINSQNGPESLNSNSLSAAFIDQSQCLWVCTFGGGVNYFDLHEKPFHTLRPNPAVANSVSSNYVRAVMADGDSLWVGTSSDGLRLYDMKTTQISSYQPQNKTVTALTLDNDHNLWLGGNNGIEIFRARSKNTWKPPGHTNFPKYSIETLARDCFGNIWFGNHTDKFGVIWKDETGYYHTKYYGEGFFILTDSILPQLFVSSTQGLKRLIVDNKGNIIAQTDYRAAAKPNSLSSDYTYPVAKLNDSTYWVGTIGGGLNNLTLHADGSHTIKTYDGKYGIFNDVESLEIDNQGNIWIGGNGLECFNPTTLNLVKFDKNDGLQGNSFKVNSSYKGADGKLYFGGISGLNYFYPEQIQPNKILSTPRITDILINNQHPLIGKGANSLQQAIGYSNNITINYLQNNFVIFFSSMHYANPLKCRYRYKLAGFNDDWQYTDGKNPSAVYSNVDYKTYQFIVEATNDDGVWSGKTASITVIVTPPWWKSTLAKIIYGLLLASLIAGFYIYQARWHKLKRDIAVREINERKREEMHRQREELHQQQLTFFTNISHEFRTPLTLILGPLETLMHSNKNNQEDGLYKLMFRNAKRLMNLITELMNFRKAADSIIKLHIRPVNIYKFCFDMAEDFENTALSKDLSFRFINNTKKKPEELIACVDMQVLEKIISNLLNNAVKYTDINGEVTFEIFTDISTFKPSFGNGFTLLHPEHSDKKYLYFRIVDNGIGISAESINQIFDRYYRISSNHLGSGIGLALVKHLTLLHKGDIYVYSERHTGTEIIIGIPWETASNHDVERASVTYESVHHLEPIDKSMLLSEPEFTSNKAISSEGDRKNVLIVEDNQELRIFLKETMEKHYNIYEAENGLEGLEIAREKIPDLIISDVMMPKMGGLDFCKAIKEKFETSHIPFIILSAKDALDTKIEGMESGADLYFAKPLSIELLLLTIQNLFRQRDLLRLRYTENYLLEATELVQSDKDKDFLNTLVQLIEDNMQDADLDVDFLCKHLHVSRTKLYQKIKSVSGQSVGEFIRIVRLKKSVHLMTHEGISMSEVAYRVGMQSSSNFSRAFKKKYGKSPLQFMQELKNQDKAKPVS